MQTNISNLTTTVNNLQLKSLTDVSDSLAPTTNQVLRYTGTEWTAQTLPTPAQALDDLTDVIITTPSTNQVLKYDGSSWVNGTDSGIPDSNQDGFSYVRKNGVWQKEQIQSDVPISDNIAYH